MKTSKIGIETASKLSLASFFIGLAGVALSVWGASWDITSHLLRTPETFFTPSHMLLYTGVGISLISALLNVGLIVRNKQIRNSSFIFASKLIIIGAIFQIIAGPGDFYWHEMFGLDGLLSPTHFTLALGILMVSIGVIIGFTRIRSDFGEKNKFIKTMIPISFGIFWFNVMWLIFFFVLPISEGETHDFNPEPHVAIVLSFLTLPFAFSLVFWSASKSMNVFGASSIAALTFIIMNITSNIFTSENLMMYLPWFAAPMISAIGADYILNKKTKSKIIQEHKNKISGAILGSTFFLFCFPMLAMTFLEIYVYNDVFPYDVLHTSSDMIFDFWMMTVIPGVIAGMLGMIFASKKLASINFKNN